MTDAISVTNLSKKYIIGHQKQDRYTTLRDVTMHKIRGIGQRLRHPLSMNKEDVDIEEFWALRDITIDVAVGDRIGIIGQNGAGKSTLLKILSRITEPTKGIIKIKGKVSSLLEVGTGFHPELTGRENIFLNGAILGMNKNEIKSKFDEIVAFSEVDKFLDTPVKRYSSGMYVRLAFAVAAHLEPEILIVDEVLAVGDSVFQKKCLGKMDDIASEGRTVIFVSHNMGAINNLCNRAVVLNKGQLVFNGGVNDAINYYMSSVFTVNNININHNTFVKNANLPIQIRSIIIKNDKKKETLSFERKENIIISINIDVNESSNDYYIAIIIFDSIGNCLIHAKDGDERSQIISGMNEGNHNIEVIIPGNIFKAGDYSLSIAVGKKNHGSLDKHNNVVIFSITDLSSNRSMKSIDNRRNLVSPIINWITKY